MPHCIEHLDYNGSPIIGLALPQLPKPVLISEKALADLEADGPLAWRLISGVPCVATRPDQSTSSAARRILGESATALIAYRDHDPFNLTFGNLGIRTSAGTEHFISDPNPLFTAPWPILRAREQCRPTRHKAFVLPCQDHPDAHHFREND